MSRFVGTYSSIVIDHIQQTIFQDDVRLVYIYCGYKEPNQSVINLIGSLLKQLVQCHDELSDDLVKLYEKHKSSQSRLSMDQYLGLLRTEIDSYSKVFVVVDALDELSEQSDTRGRFITEILRLPSSVGVLATSRHVATIKDAFQGITSLEISASDDDVRNYVGKRIEATPQLASLLQDRQALRDAVSDAIVDKAKGMSVLTMPSIFRTPLMLTSLHRFLAAELHMNSLKLQDNVRDVRKAMKNLPRELDGIYDDAMKRIQSQDMQKIKRGKQVLSWICYAVRPLSVAELQHALAVDYEDESLEREAIPPNVDALVSTCAGLVTVDQESGIIRFVHYTTQRFFERTRADYFLGAPIEISMTCLTYLSFKDFQAGACPSNLLSRRISDYPFLLYAADYWADHVRYIEAEPLEQLLRTFLRREAQVTCAVQAANIPKHPFARLGKHLPKIVPILWLMAHYDLKRSLHQLLDEGEDIEARNSLGETALYRASLDGHEQIVHLLLEYGADVNARGGTHGTALHAAVYNGHKTIVFMLVNRGADMEAQCSESTGTALQAALRRGDQSIVTLLLDKGADPNAGLGRCGNALHMAVISKNIEMVEMLLDRGADINGEGLCCGTALQEAVWRRLNNIIGLLLDRGAEARYAIQHAAWNGDLDGLTISMQKTTGREGYKDDLNRALVTAASQGHYESFVMLLDGGADIHTRGGEYDTLLQTAAASIRGRHPSWTHVFNAREIVALLLEKGASIGTEGGYYGNALQAAASQGHDDIVALLLQWGADVNARGGHFGTALQAAASGAGHFGIEGNSIKYEHRIRMKLEEGADVEAVVESLLGKPDKNNFRDGNPGIPAQANLSVNNAEVMDGKLANYEKVVSLLQDKGVDVKAHGGYLHFDDRPSRYEKTIHMLLEKGADVNALCGHFGTALQAAICEEHGSGTVMPNGGNLKIARLFLDRRADVNAKGGPFGTALEAAAAEGNPEMVQMLLQAGAEVNHQGGCCNNALQAAAEGRGSAEQQEEIVALLLNRRAVVERSDWSCNAVTAAAKSGFEKVVVMLLASCTEVDGELLVGALTLAARHGHHRVVQLLLERRRGVGKQDECLEIALHAASGHARYRRGVAESNYINILNMLLSEGARLNRGYGRYALLAAMAESNYELVDVLLANGADINYRGGSFGNALQALALGLGRWGDTENESKGQQLIATLLDRGVDVNAKGGVYGTALQAAVNRGLEATVVTLLERGAKVNHQGGKFGTALHAAVFSNFLHIIQILLRYGVDIETPDQYGFTVLYWVQNDRVLTSSRRREVRNMVSRVAKGPAARLVDVATRKRNITSMLEQLKQERDDEAPPFYDLGKALLYDGRYEAAAFCFEKQYSIETRERKPYDVTTLSSSGLGRECLKCCKTYEYNNFYICKVCRHFLLCSSCIEATSNDVCKTHGFLEIKREDTGETTSSLKDDRSLDLWIERMLLEYQT